MAGIVPDLRYILRSHVKDRVAKLTAKVFANFLIWIYHFDMNVLNIQFFIAVLSIDSMVIEKPYIFEKENSYRLKVR